MPAKREDSMDTRLSAWSPAKYQNRAGGLERNAAGKESGRPASRISRAPESLARMRYHEAVRNPGPGCTMSIQNG